VSDSESHITQVKELSKTQDNQEESKESLEEEIEEGESDKGKVSSSDTYIETFNSAAFEYSNSSVDDSKTNSNK